METGIVIKSVGSRYRVICTDGTVIECTLKGKLRVKDIKTTNPVAVGDNVLVETDIQHKTGVIVDVLDRKNYILRKSSNLSRQSQVIAANIDQAILMVTIVFPETLPEFIDRYLVTAEAYRVPAILLFNKTDLYGEEDNEKMKYLISVYERVGYRCQKLSIKTGEGLDEVKTALRDKISLISGNSGVGKSSLINALHPGLNLKTEEISSYHKQGKHVTTFPEMFKMPFGGFVIDTPGIRGFGVVDMERNEIYHFFPEIFRISEQCRYYNCLHLNEPGCAVIKAVEDGLIDILRSRSYWNIINDVNRNYR